jgi:hypothetical protein
MQFVALLHRFFEGRLTSGISSSSSNSAIEDEDNESTQEDKDNQSEPRSSVSSSDPIRTLHNQQVFSSTVGSDLNEVGSREQNITYTKIKQEDTSGDLPSASDTTYAESQHDGDTKFQILVDSSLTGVPSLNPKKRATIGPWFRARGIQADPKLANASAFDRTIYNSMSENSMWKCSLVLRHIDACDWKLSPLGKHRPPSEDVVLVINPHHHLVDEAWRRVRMHCTARKLCAVRVKLTEAEKANVIPKVARKFAFLVIVANTRDVAKRVLAAERVRLGFTGPSTDLQGLKLDGLPLSPSSIPIRSSAFQSARTSNAPEVSISEGSPAKIFVQLEERRKLQLEASVAAAQRRAEAASNKRFSLVAPTDRVTRQKLIIKDEGEGEETRGANSASKNVHVKEDPEWTYDLLPTPAAVVQSRYDHAQTQEQEEVEEQEQGPKTGGRISMDFTPI